MIDRLKRRADAIEARQASETGGLNIRLAVLRPGMTAEGRQAWRAEQAAMPGPAFVLRIVPWPMRTPGHLEEALESGAVDRANLQAGVLEMGDPRATAMLHRHLAGG